MASTSVVLPWSTWATIATLRRSSRMAADMRKRSFRKGRGLLESTGAVGAGRTRRPCPRAWPGHPTARRASRPAAGRDRPRRLAPDLRSRGSGWSPSLTPRVTISSRRSALSSTGPRAWRNALVRSSLTSSSASSASGSRSQPTSVSPTHARASDTRSTPPSRRQVAMREESRPASSATSRATSSSWSPSRPSATRRWSQSGSRPSGPSASAAASRSRPSSMSASRDSMSPSV